MSVSLRPECRFFFFFNDTATTEIYTLSLHDALPILHALPRERLPGGVAVHRLSAQSEAPPQTGDRPRMNDFGLAVMLFLAYLIGATPTSYIAGRLGKGIDLREHGSNNLGATNVYRVLGWKYAIPVGVIDMVKGAVPVAILGPWSNGPAWFTVALGLAAVLGHMFSPYVRFRGGKGVATAAEPDVGGEHEIGRAHV